MRKINKIVIHCSDSLFGNRDIIDQWHKRRGFRCIGYHYLITNGRLYGNKRKYRVDDDGIIQKGRPCSVKGAHVRGHNTNSIGICLIGKHGFTERQFTELHGLIVKLRRDYPGARVVAHNELDDNKTCPNMSGYFLRNIILA